MWLLWGYEHTSARRTGWDIYYGVFTAMERSAWIEHDKSVPPRPIEWHVYGPLKRGAGFDETIALSLATTIIVGGWLYARMPVYHRSPVNRSIPTSLIESRDTMVP